MMRTTWRTMSALALAAGLAVATVSPASAQAETLGALQVDVASLTMFGTPEPIDQATLVQQLGYPQCV